MIPLLFGVLIFLIFSSPALADTSLLINEILPYPITGTKEWVEFFNPSSVNLQVANFKVTEKTSTGNVVSHNLPSFSLAAGEVCYYQFSSSSLNNDQDTVTLIDGNGTTLDSYSYKNATQNKAFARVPDGGPWLANVNPSLSQICSDSLTPKPASPLQVSLSEFMPNPTKGAKEWVEIYNESSEPADISGLQIDDGPSGSAPFVILDGTSIPPHGFVVFNFESKLNNNGDTVRLLYADNSVIDETTYQNSTEGVSIAKNSQGSWLQTTTPTPNGPNQITAPTTINPTTTVKTTTTNPTKATTTLTQTKTISKTTSQNSVLGTRTATSEASGETSHIKLSFNDDGKKTEKPLVKGDSYSKYLSYGLIGIGIIIIGAPLLIFLKKKYA